MILARPTTDPNDVHAMAVVAGILTEMGGATSHAAVVSRELGVPCIVGCGEDKLMPLAGKEVTFDGSGGEVFEGRIPLTKSSEDDDPELAKLAGWAARGGSGRRRHTASQGPRAAPRRLNAMGGSRLEGKSAVVTGGASGLGRAMAEAFIAEGARVAIADISGEQDAVADELGDAAVAIKVDTSKEDEVEAMIASAVESFGGLDILCNNAGVIGVLAPTHEYGIEEFDKVIAVNLRGVFLGMHFGIPAMVSSGGGSVINTSSIEGLVSFPGASGYCASKSGVLGLPAPRRWNTAPRVSGSMRSAREWRIRR